MFDVQIVGRKIGKLRKKCNLTQMELADRMGVSYQAVSNWERGSSMPDISKLPELAGIFGVSVDSLLAGNSGEEMIQHVLSGDVEDYIQRSAAPLEEIAEVAPLLKPSQVEEIVDNLVNTAGWTNETAGEGPKKKINVEVLEELAPFLDQDQLAELVGWVEAGTVTMEIVAELAPFLNKENLNRLLEHASRDEKIAGEILGDLAPFLDQGQLGELVSRVEAGSASMEIVAELAPFLNKENLNRLLEQASKDEEIAGEILEDLAPFLDQVQLGELVGRVEEGSASLETVAELAPFLNKENLNRLLEQASKDEEITGGILEDLAPFLDQGQLGELVGRVEAGSASLETVAELAPFLNKENLGRLLRLAINREE